MHMELLIHGSKHGYKANLNPNKPTSFYLSDIRNDYNTEKSIGKSLYSLAFINQGCVYSKYTIIRDTLRSYATGNIAFSLFIPASKQVKGSGKDIKSLLDRLSNVYFDKYIVSYNNNRDQREIIQEDWSFIEPILNEFILTNTDYSKDDLFTSGKEKPAFHYYHTEDELLEYFNRPYQEDYKRFQQILLIDSAYKGEADPLHVLENSGEEININFKNPKYKLINYRDIAGFTLKINGALCTSNTSSIVVRENDKIEIIFNREHYEKINVEGNLSNRDSAIFRYLKLNTESEKIQILYDKIQITQRQTIEFKLFRYNERNYPITNGEIKLDNGPWKKEASISFEGADLSKPHVIQARLGKEFRSHPVEFVPYNFNGDVILYPVVYVEFNVSVAGNNASISGYDVYIDKLPPIKNVIKHYTHEFINDKPNHTYQIYVCKDEFEASQSKTINLETPKSHTLEFVLRKKAPLVYQVDLGKHGSFKNGQIFSSKSKDGIDIKDKIQIDFGWIFTEFKLSNNVLYAQYEPNVFLITGLSFLIFLIVSLPIAFLLYTDSPDGHAVLKRRIEDYTQGIELHSDTLKSYRKSWEDHEHEYIQESPWWDLFSPASQRDSSKWYSEWKPIEEGIERALSLRDYSDRLDFSNIKKFEGSKSQMEYISFIEGLDSSDYKLVKSNLRNSKNINLHEIITIISDIKENSSDFESEKPENDEEQGKSGLKNKNDSPINELSTDNTLSETIKTAFNSTKLEATKLDEYLIKAEAQKPKDTKLINSIKLYIKFWELNEGIGNPYAKLLNEVNNDVNLQNSKLKNALERLRNSSKYGYQEKSNAFK